MNYSAVKHLGFGILALVNWSKLPYGKGYIIPAYLISKSRTSVIKLKNVYHLSSVNSLTCPVEQEQNKETAIVVSSARNSDLYSGLLITEYSELYMRAVDTVTHTHTHTQHLTPESGIYRFQNVLLLFHSRFSNNKGLSSKRRSSYTLWQRKNLPWLQNLEVGKIW